MTTIFKILITGGTGFIGKALVDNLLKENHQITILTRNKSLKNNHQITYINNLDQVEFNFDIIINLAGSPIAVNWNDRNKKEIVESRINITQNLVDKINNSQNPVQLFISGSAVGIYGINHQNHFDKISNEDNEISIDNNIFSQKLCDDWEKTALQAQSKTRVVLLRTGIVLGRDGGILKKMLTPFFFGLGGKIGNGKQIMSWIAIEDVVGIIKLIIADQTITKAINACSPNPVSNHHFSSALAQSLNRPCLLTIPEFTLKLIYGKMAQELMIEGQKILPKKAQSHSYKFQFEQIEDCLANIFLSKQ
ncbi:epimerase [Alphaproteobacteria bacterium]|nr:epimerase [Alphaproteobacteria bacterium]